MRICAVGDLIFDLDEPDWNDPGFKELQDLLQGADVRFANLEAPLTDRGGPIAKFDITRADPIAASWVHRLGFQVVSLANNHIMDYGPQGLRSTIEVLNTQGVLHCGAGADEQAAFAPVVVTTGDKRVAFVSFFTFYFPGMERYTDPIQADGCPGAATIRAFQVRVPHGPPQAVLAPEERFLAHLLNSIAEARKQADWVVVSMHSHFGLECAEVIDPARRLLAHLAIDAGADLVLGHGPHTTNGLELYRGRWIAHSLGNFYCHVPLDVLRYNYPDSRLYIPKYLAERAYWEAFVVEADFHNGPPEELIIHPFEVIQLGSPHHGMPRRGNEELAARTLERLQAHSQGMGVHVEQTGRSLRAFPDPGRAQ